jgi:putative heme-binding domain-containing protein
MQRERNRGQTPRVAVENAELGCGHSRDLLPLLQITLHLPNQNSLERIACFSTTQASLDTPLIDLLASIVPKKEETWNTRQRHEFLDMLQVALGDRKLTLPQQSDPPSADVMDGYRAISVRQLPMNVRGAWVDWLLFLTQRAATASDEGLESECLRTLAMLEPTDKKSLSFLLGLSKPSTHPTFDLHLLCCIAACSVARTESESIRTAEILSGVVRKTKDYGAYTDNQWPKRIQQLITVLQSRDSALGASLLSLPTNCIPEEIVLWNAFSVDIQAKAKSKMRDRLLAIPPAQWTSAVVKHCLQSQPLSEELRASLREAASLPALRNTAIELLSSATNEKDYSVYLDALNGDDKNIWSAAWRGIQSLEIQSPEQEFLVLSKLVSHVLNTASTLQSTSVLARCRKAAKAVGKKDVPVSDKWSDWEPFLTSNVPIEIASCFSQPAEKLDWRAMIPQWSSLVADGSRGKTLYEQKCLNCHGGQSALGPSLSGVARRFSREDLAKAIYEPSRDIPDRYRSAKILTTDGEILTGIVVYTAADGTTLYTAKGEMIRINKSQIEEQGYSTESLMPSGLLSDCDAQQVADLFNYLGTLN